MSQLALHGRPWVVFNPTNKEHRTWYAEFVRTGTWGRCPVRFVVTDDRGNLVTMIQQNLVKYYVNQEFKARRKR
jgi:hypothetical protein